MSKTSFICKRWSHVLLNRFPLKCIVDAVAIIQIVIKGKGLYGDGLTWRHKKACIQFYFVPENIRRMMAIHSRSGMTWSLLGLQLAINLSRGRDADYTNEGSMFWPTRGIMYRRFDWRVPMGSDHRMYNRTEGPVYDEQFMYVGRLPYYQLRNAKLKEMKIVLVTRSILSSLDSRFHKFATDPKRRESLENEAAFDWDRYLGEAIAFQNSWADVMTWHPNIRHFRFEDMKADPISTHKEMLDFWGEEVSEENLREGFAHASKKEMAKRLPGTMREKNIRFSSRPASDRGKLSAPLKKHLRTRLANELISDFGYDYQNDDQHYVNYD